MSIAIQAEHISKKYNLGTISSGTLFRDLNMYWAKMRGKTNPYAKLGDNGEFNESEHWALRDVSFEIKQGEAVGIIGRNGAGKSTLLKILSRVTTPTTGQIKIRGRVASLLEVGTGFHPEMTGRENIFLNGAILGMTKAEIRKKFDEIVDFAGIEKYIDTPVKRYSSGMYVRLAFAVAAHLEPEILIVDEVLAVGDAEFQKKCLGKMNDVSKNEGRTVLFVSHNLGAVKSLCNKGILLKNGELILSSHISHAIKKYADYYPEIPINKYNLTPNIKTRVINLNTIKIINSFNQEINSIDVETKFGINLNLDILDYSNNPIIGITLLDENKNHIFISFSNIKFNKIGNTEVTLWIPNNFLNDGKLYFIVGAATYVPFEIFFEYEFALTILDVHNHFLKMGYNGKIDGSLRPSLEWT